ncbi:MAG: zinc-binding dehydrogenase, partial [Planctomycetaceae bacterium]|nr:zinc-binding dehydrogenase [Planctomycetaceae bacterium]
HDGAFADSLIVPECNLHVIPDHVPTDHAVFVEPLAAACRIPQQITIHAGERVVVVGDGRLGNLCAQVLQHHGCRVSLVGKHRFKLNVAEQCGLQNCLLLDDVSTDHSADIVVDCTGSDSGLQSALQLVRPCGTIVLKTTVAAESTLHLAPFVIDEVTVLGSRCGPFDTAIELLAADAVSVAPLISDRFPLEDAVAAFDRAVQKNVLKVLFDVSQAECPAL